MNQPAVGPAGRTVGEGRPFPPYPQVWHDLGAKKPARRDIRTLGRLVPGGPSPPKALEALGPRGPRVFAPSPASPAPHPPASAKADSHGRIRGLHAERRRRRVGGSSNGERTGSLTDRGGRDTAPPGTGKGSAETSRAARYFRPPRPAGLRPQRTARKTTGRAAWLREPGLLL